MALIVESEFLKWQNWNCSRSKIKICVFLLDRQIANFCPINWDNIRNQNTDKEKEVKIETLESEIFLSSLFLSIDFRFDTKTGPLKGNVFGLELSK